MPTLGVVIVSYNTRDLLRACLESLRACTLPLRVVVVDSASHDDSATLVRAEFAEVELIALDQNVGFAAGTNIGIRHTLGAACGVTDSALNDSQSHAAKLDFILLLNPDTVVYPGALEALVCFLAAHPRVGMVGPRLLNPDGTVQPAAFRFPTLAMSLLDLFPPGEVLPGRLYGSWWHGRYPQERAGSAPFAIDHPLGACMLVRRAVVEQVGLLDEAFFMYAEEVDWCYRIRRAGWAIWQVPAAQVMHVGGAATRQFRQRMLVALYHSRLRFFRKHYSARFVRWHSWIVHAGMLRAALLTWRAYGRGALTADELRARLWAYGKIMQL
jgi:N-acetylglucosaminyl-diphospho-decaprenol L-rhamnosyltransferase